MNDPSKTITLHHKRNKPLPTRTSDTYIKPMPKPSVPPEADDPEQSRRFIDMAQKVGADEESKAAERVVGRLGKMPREPKVTRPLKTRKSP